ncbi:hypothetical protein BL250_16015 [Erwinia sp. OLTSP20]|uniref:MBL fold metallo-hydrolase n=1 Tax=unclassified Erwinia TaxID=2622719 RepID=UPI000C1A7A0E|nr:MULTISPECIES: MBL fold metallo-hydrolase [unclassified Erwinia]PIJ49223.1 hypothetical protein BV501_13510 [Erwinia sp. OAMSP11]PIJ70505.1 hypothetical protein BK416_13150 [Erwinia sp. OLSSP12]PIJ78745.1 hypothetical protein BLD47_16950 [Erwinia sp. OLCASP19]PIJ81232.1 hypothetical protein BLD46_12915 [Erwinia sp. OLMTSP26]PIJ84481.1 hypothetical protein BLD49_12120 [Erwinia sp. OLMDSP33]
MMQIYEDLWVSTPEVLTENTAIPPQVMHGFLLKHLRGNILISRMENPLDHQAIDEAGGIFRHYLTHWHEAGPALPLLQQRFNAALYCHNKALGAVTRVAEPDDTFSEAEVHCGSFHVVPTPGHTPGSTSYLYASPGGITYLFVGDTLTLYNGQWVTMLTDDSNTASLQQSLDFYRALRPNVLLLTTTSGEQAWQEVDLPRWLAIIDEAENTPLDLRSGDINCCRTTG